MLGNVRNNANTGIVVANRGGGYSGSITYWFTNQTTPLTITEADVASRFNTTTVAAQFGFALNVIK